MLMVYLSIANHSVYAVTSAQDSVPAPLVGYTPHAFSGSDRNAGNRPSSMADRRAEADSKSAIANPQSNAGLAAWPGGGILGLHNGGRLR